MTAPVPPPGPATYAQSQQAGIDALLAIAAGQRRPAKTPGFADTLPLSRYRPTDQLAQLAAEAAWHRRARRLLRSRTAANGFAGLPVRTAAEAGRVIR
jgi:hypothetical protein